MDESLSPLANGGRRVGDHAYININWFLSTVFYLTTIIYSCKALLSSLCLLPSLTYTMKFAITALLAGFAAAAPAAAPAAAADAFETVTISHFLYVGVNGYPQISFNIHSQQVDSVNCEATHIEVGSVYSCDDPSYTFKVLAEQGKSLTLTHVLNG